MKDKALYLWILIILLSMGASAISTDLKKDYSQQETIMIKINAKVLEPISAGQVKFIRAGHIQEVPIEFGVKKLGDYYYIWAIAPAEPQNITLIIKGIESVERGVPKKSDYQQNFTIGNTSRQYSVKPGALSSDSDFKIKIISYAEDSFEIKTDFPEARTIKIEPGENIINFSIDKISGARLHEIKIGDYSIPAYLIGNFTKIQESSPITFEPPSIRKEISEGEKYAINFSITNRVEDKIKDIEIRLSDELFIIEGERKFTLDKGGKAFFNLSLRKDDKIAIREIITAKSEKYETALPVSIDFEEKTIKINDKTDTPDEGKLYRCAELQGKICKGEEICKGNKNQSLEGICCLGTCVTEKESKSDSKAIGYIIAAVVLLGIVVLYIRYKRIKSDSNLITRKFKEAEKRFP